MPKTTNKLAQKHLRSGRWITERKRFAIYLRDQQACVYCRSDLSAAVGTSGAVLDHVDAGRGNGADNLITTCKRCNDGKGGDAVTTWAKDRAMLARVAHQCRLPIDEDAGQRLYESIRGISTPGNLPKLPRLTVGQAAALVQMSPAEVEARIGQEEFTRKNGTLDVAEVVRVALMSARRVAQIAGEKSEHSARKAKADADEAELRAMEAGGKLCAMSDAKQFWSDARIEVRQKIERASYLTPVQKTKLLAELVALKTKLTPKD